jgi:membrane glycosyltransferase
MAEPMDMMTAATTGAMSQDSRPGPVSGARPALPPELRLVMPVQSLRRWRDSDGRKGGSGMAHAKPWLTRIFVFGGAWALTGYGAWEMYNVVSVSRTTILQYVLLALFTINFSWIALAFTSAIAGFVALLRHATDTPHAGTLRSRTAIVMPVYNELTSRTFAAVAAIRESVDATGLGSHFDYFIVSDSTHPDAWIAEERAYLALRERMGPDARLYYRHRPKNHHRKAGNIADFVMRWGGAYEAMIVLDADSLMTGTCIVRLASAMENDPDAGIIQSLPLIINRNTLFARLQQFAARVYGPVIATGLSLWMGRDGNYWGHNAIIRTAAFAAHCGLPDLKGKPPFGGHIMSHDFVEAALMRRAGWDVYMLPDLTGSYEESPPSLIDVSVRDRRWCQGNLQHSRVIGAAGLKLASRQHFATGIMAYMASPFWLMQLMVGIALVLQVKYARPEYFTSQFTLLPEWPRFDPERALALFGLTMAILLAPKLFGLILTLINSKQRRACGGGIRLTISALFEVLFSALFAPIMMVIQSGSVFQILMGRDTGWNPQRRDDGSIPMTDIIRRHRAHVTLGVVTGISAFMIATSLFAWMSPTILGLVLAIPLSWASGQLSFGLALKRWKLLLTPEEGEPPEVATRANILQAEFAKARFDDADALEALHADQALLEAHVAMLPDAAPRASGQFDPDLVMAQAKLVEAAQISDAVSWLRPKERMTLLHDRALLSLLSRLQP